MTSSQTKSKKHGASGTTQPLAKYVVVSDVSLTVTLDDGRIVSVPLEWYPRLAHGTPAERNRWRLLGRGIGIHWPDLDEDISVDGILGGRRSMEGAASFKQWLSYRARGEAVPVPELPLPPDLARYLNRSKKAPRRSPRRTARKVA
jgi:hypothetical protein